MRSDVGAPTSLWGPEATAPSGHVRVHVFRFLINFFTGLANFI